MCERDAIILSNIATKCVLFRWTRFSIQHDLKKQPTRKEILQLPPESNRAGDHKTIAIYMTDNHYNNFYYNYLPDTVTDRLTIKNVQVVVPLSVYKFCTKP